MEQQDEQFSLLILAQLGLSECLEVSNWAIGVFCRISIWNLAVWILGGSLWETPSSDFGKFICCSWNSPHEFLTKCLFLYVFAIDNRVFV
jgi:hypothetical protein